MSKPFYSLFALSIIFMKCYADSSNICAPSTCGNLPIRYPFWKKSNTIIGEFCGYPDFGLECKDGQAIMALPSDTYLVTDINYANHSITLVDIDIMNQPCPRAQHNVSLHSLPLSFSSLDLNLSFYFNCSSSPPLSVYPIGCLKNIHDREESYVLLSRDEAEYGYEWRIHCKEHVVVTVQKGEIESSGLITGFGDAMKKGFVLNWIKAGDCAECEQSGGNCGYDQTKKQSTCICKNGRTDTKSCKKVDGPQIE